MFNPSYKYTFPPELYISQKPYLEVVRSTKRLGLVLSDNLKWTSNTDFIIFKAMKRIWTLRILRKLGFGDQFILDVYFKEVRVMLEYAVQIWNGALTQRDCDRIEKVQKIVLKFLWQNKYTSYTDACKFYKLPKLAVRRKSLCLRFAKKELKKPNGLFQNSHLRKVAKNKLVIQPKSRTQRHFSSGFSYLARILNESQN